MAYLNDTDVEDKEKQDELSLELNRRLRLTRIIGLFRRPVIDAARRRGNAAFFYFTKSGSLVVETINGSWIHEKIDRFDSGVKSLGWFG